MLPAPGAVVTPRCTASTWEREGIREPLRVRAGWVPRSLNTHWEGIRVQAGLPGVRLHDLRHTVVSLLLELGTPPHVVQAIARHADLDVTMEIYAHTNLDTMREALDKIDWGAE
jgi:integrase